MINKTKPINRLVFSVVGVILLSLLSPLALAHGMSEADKLAIIEGGNLRYMWLGATHMLSGYDHLAFVFGIIFFLKNFRDIAKYVTAFTLGHSVTLIYATFNGIQMNYFLIDAVIGLSVCYIAFSNIDGFRKYLSIRPPNMLFMIIGLGLIHGFGLSTRLQELPLSEDELLLNIISFNVGIELGQISALALMLLLIAAWRKTHAFQTFSLVANYALILSGALLFLMQMHGYEHNANAAEFMPANPVIGAPAVVGVDVVDKMAIAGDDMAISGGLQPSSWQDTILITIPARGDKEYKLYLAQGANLAYSWQGDGAALFFDFHGEPAGDKTGYFESYSKGTKVQAEGSLTTSFAGTHGWYWKNNSTTSTVITLSVKGDYRRLDEKKALSASAAANHDTIDTP